MNILPGSMINKRVDQQTLCQLYSHLLTDSLDLIPSALANLAAGSLMSTNFKSPVVRFHAKRQKWPQTSRIIRTEQGSPSSTAHRAPIGHFVGWLHAKTVSLFFFQRLECGIFYSSLEIILISAPWQSDISLCVSTLCFWANARFFLLLRFFFVSKFVEWISYCYFWRMQRLWSSFVFFPLSARYETAIVVLSLLVDQLDFEVSLGTGSKAIKKIKF